METIFLIILTSVILYKLWTVLGTRTGHEKPKDWAVGQYTEVSQTDQNNIIVLPLSNVNKVKNDVDIKDAPYQKSLSALVEKIPQFQAGDFIEGAVRAFSLIVTSFAKGQLKPIQNFVSKDVFLVFENAVHARTENHEKLELELYDVTGDIDHIQLDHEKALITVRFQSEQMFATTSADGLIHDNPAKLQSTVIDYWVFERFYDSASPAWLLVKTSVSSPYQESKASEKTLIQED